MKEGFPNLTETSENPERIKMETGQVLQDQLKEKLLDFLDPVLRNFFDTKEIRKDVEKLRDTHEDAIQLSFETGEFFRDLIPNGLRKPEIKGVPSVGYYNLIMMSEGEKRGQLVHGEVAKLSRKEYREKKKEILKDSLHGREKLAAEGEVKEVERSDGSVEQTVVNAWGQDGNQNLIYERVDNNLDRPRNTNRTQSSLVIQDIESGITLDLNALLPSSYKYVPRFMDKAFCQLDPENPITGVIYKQEEIADLKDYKMGVSTQRGDFRVMNGYRTVNYGDLRQTGQILSLLHEVAHSWQAKYHMKNQGRVGFEMMHEYVADLIYKIDLPIYAQEYKESEKIWEKLEKVGMECLDKNGLEAPTNKEGIVNFPNSHYSYVKFLENDRLNKTEGFSPDEKKSHESKLAYSKPRIRFYPIKSAALQELMDSYVAEERDAWAHAIRTVRFLRSKGLDVEPELKKLEDFKVIIDPCLGSYQNHIEKTILNENIDYKFSKLPK